MSIVVALALARAPNSFSERRRGYATKGPIGSTASINASVPAVRLATLSTQNLGRTVGSSVRASIWRARLVRVSIAFTEIPRTSPASN